MRRTLSTKVISTLAELPKQSLRILEISIGHSSPCVGLKVKDIQLPRDSLLVALQHKFKAKVPTAEDVILAGDRVVVIVNDDQEKALLRCLV